MTICVMLRVTATVHYRTIRLVEPSHSHFMHDLTLKMTVGKIFILTILTIRHLVTKEFAHPRKYFLSVRLTVSVRYSNRKH